MTTDVHQIREMVARVPRPAELASPGGAHLNDIESLERKHGLALPDDLKKWLLAFNGAPIGPGGVFGVGDIPRHLSIDHYFGLYPEWRDAGFVPIAGDGCGGYFVIDSRVPSGFPVHYVDPHEDSLQPQYAVASNLFSFLRFLLLREMGETRWPFDREYVLDLDPNLSSLGKVVLPWDAT